MALEILAYEITLVLSAMVLVFWVAYCLMLYSQLKHGTVRKDWWISMVFYVGIGLLVLGNLVLALSKIYATQSGEDASILINLISMLLFLVAFYLRMQHALRVQSFSEPKSGREKSGKTRTRKH